MSFMPKSAEASVKKNGGLTRILISIACVILAGYVVTTIISTKNEIEESKKLYQDLCEQTEVMLEENAAIERYLVDDANMDEYIEEIAREKLDYANPDERVYYIIPASE